MQDLLLYIAKKQDICLVVLDHRGLTTNTKDLLEFLRQYPQVKRIIVDKSPFTNEIMEYNCSDLWRKTTSYSNSQTNRIITKEVTSKGITDLLLPQTSFVLKTIVSLRRQ
ncbi:predicted protein [Lichtheimia corymbifera JMRC:FSU:9682]|uniref:Uncharacterized protein n=1 Tax=Lichtheimia corymbifera JMRC:FSU:9682 TaxID=1263082 RepID=A0A068RWU3_9FUNG|nr:predicted protein [Lichtheimia corymbifera JMRC:FSU:9682]